MDPAPVDRGASSRPTRRALLGGAIAAATIGALWFEGLPNPFRPRRARATPEGEPPRHLEPGELRTLGAMQARLLPSDGDGPGAAEVNAAGYLDGVLGDDGVDADARRRVREAAAHLDAFARSAGAAEFAGLSPESQDAGIRTLEATWEDELKLRVVLLFTLEAFLGDPVHGGNPDGSVWAWAEHRPGYPRPQGPWAPAGTGPREEGER